MVSRDPATHPGHRQLSPSTVSELSTAGSTPGMSFFAIHAIHEPEDSYIASDTVQSVQYEAQTWSRRWFLFFSRSVHSDAGKGIVKMRMELSFIFPRPFAVSASWRESNCVVRTSTRNVYPIFDVGIYKRLDKCPAVTGIFGQLSRPTR